MEELSGVKRTVPEQPPEKPGSFWPAHFGLTQHYLRNMQGTIEQRSQARVRLRKQVSRENFQTFGPRPWVQPRKIFQWHVWGQGGWRNLCFPPSSAGWGWAGRHEALPIVAAPGGWGGRSQLGPTSRPHQFSPNICTPTFTKWTLFAQPNIKGGIKNSFENLVYNILSKWKRCLCLLDKHLQISPRAPPREESGSNLDLCHVLVPPGSPEG